MNLLNKILLKKLNNSAFFYTLITSTLIMNNISELFVLLFKDLSLLNTTEKEFSVPKKRLNLKKLDH